MASASYHSSTSRPGTASTTDDSRRVEASLSRGSLLGAHLLPSSSRNRSQTMDSSPRSAPISRTNSDFSISLFPSLERLPSSSSDLSFRPSSRNTRSSTTSSQPHEDNS